MRTLGCAVVRSCALLWLGCAGWVQASSCPEYLEKEGLIAELEGASGRVVRVLPGASSEWRFTYVPELDAGSFRAVLEGDDVTQIFLDEEGRLLNMVQLDIAAKESRLTLAGHFDGDTPPPGCSKPPLRWQSWVIREEMLKSVVSSSALRTSREEFQARSWEPGAERR